MKKIKEKKMLRQITKLKFELTRRSTFERIRSESTGDANKTTVKMIKSNLSAIFLRTRIAAKPKSQVRILHKILRITSEKSEDQTRTQC